MREPFDQRLRSSFFFAAAPLALVACLGDSPSGTDDGDPGDPPPATWFTNVSGSHLPLFAVSGPSMDARPADVDGDGDLDLVVAVEFGANLVLINDGTGVFDDETIFRLPGDVLDSEDIGMADFDGDGDVDLVFVSEDDQVNEIYLNDGVGRFIDVSNRLPVGGTSNAVIVADVDRDGDEDILIGNAGQNVVLINDGTAHFTDETAQRLPSRADITQDLEVGDVDGDGDVDLLVGNEDTNRLLINDGSGRFTDETDERIEAPSETEETREADFGDADGDGDLDILFANVDLGDPPNEPRNRLLINLGTGFFLDESSDRLPGALFHSVDGDFVDVDGDGDQDLVIANAFVGNYQVLINDGIGVFEDRTADMVPANVVGDGIDVEAFDANGDGVVDLYLTNFSGTDFLLLGPTP